MDTIYGMLYWQLMAEGLPKNLAYGLKTGILGFSYWVLVAYHENRRTNYGMSSACASRS